MILLHKHINSRLVPNMTHEIHILKIIHFHSSTNCQVLFYSGAIKYNVGHFSSNYSNVTFFVCSVSNRSLTNCCKFVKYKFSTLLKTSSYFAKHG
jgi:hypothetical protein